MKNIFFLYYRCGSVLFEALCGKNWRELIALGHIQESIQAYSEWDRQGRVLHLPTLPARVCPAEDISVSLQDAQARYRNLDTWAYMVHVGDWWGQLPSNHIQGAYDYPTPHKWGWDDLLALGSEWRFSALIRDGRNQIESLRNMRGGIEEQLNKENPEDYFMVLCKGFRNRAQIIIDNQKILSDRYRVFKFEDFMANPVATMEEMFQWHGLTLDKDLVSSTLQRIQESKAHSSFKETQHLNERWLGWTEKEKDIFESIAGAELKELGYL